MDQGLRNATHSGNVDALYALMEDDSDVLRRIDIKEFVDTPLHIAAAAGHTEFAMEMMNLKPSFARKLNQRGFSPLHLALQNAQTGIVIDLLSIDKDLVRIKGREGYTPLHYVSREGNVHLLSQFLDLCPNCMLDLTVRKETALHIAAINNRFEAFEAILQRIRRTPENDQFQRKRILNAQDKDGNTPLHITASNNLPQMIELLIECGEVDRNKINQEGLTALDVVLLRQTQADSRDSLKILNRARAPSRITKMLNMNLTEHIKEMKLDTINALLVVFSLVLAMSYQAVLNPLGGVSEDDNASGSNKNDEGKSVLTPFSFLWFYIPNGVAFYIALITTMVLFEVVAKSIKLFLFPLYFLMFFCYGAAMVIIAPSTATGLGAVGAVLAILFLMYCVCVYFFTEK